MKHCSAMVLCLSVAAVAGCRAYGNQLPEREDDVTAGRNGTSASPTDPEPGQFGEEVVVSKGKAAPAAPTFEPSAFGLEEAEDVAGAAFDVSIASTCHVNTDKGIFTCLDPDADTRTPYTFTKVTQPGAGKIGVFVFRSLRLEPGAVLEVTGGLPVVIVALEDFTVLGEITAVPDGSGGVAGGSGHTGTDSTKGGGMGGGGGADGYAGGGGGSYCGVGGKGGPGTGKSGGNSVATPGEGGATYGNPEIVPLMGGSAGGVGSYGNGSAGGGAIALVAMRTLTIGPSGVVNAGGSGGNVNHDAGGSGGAILLEGSTVVVDGAVTANGGAGAHGLETGRSGRPDGTAATGGGNVAGAGNSATNINGGEGKTESGGGGAAGRIRINGKSTIKGVVSPAIGACATTGPLRAKGTPSPTKAPK